MTRRLFLGLLAAFGVGWMTPHPFSIGFDLPRDSAPDEPPWERVRKRLKDGPPLVYWKSPKPDPYLWRDVIVEMGAMGDACGCRRQAFRQYDAEKKSRWAMYYEEVPDMFSLTSEDRRIVLVEDQPTVFVFKLYADLSTLAHPINETTFYEAQRILMKEFTWLARPCGCGKKLTPQQLRPYEKEEPTHMKEVP